MRIRNLLILSVAVGAVAGRVRADFTPGHIYVTGNGLEFCRGSGDNDRIFDFDPATGTTTTFAITPEGLCDDMNGLAFTPDGKLRAAMWASSSILEFEADGSFTVPLDSSNGIFGPLGSNSIGYDAAGNFYVSTHFGDIQRFEPGSTTPTVWPNPFAGNNGPIAVLPDGQVYFARENDEQIVLFSASGQASVFDTLPQTYGIKSLALSSDGDLFISVAGLPGFGVFVYPGGDPSAPQLITSQPCCSFAFQSIAFSPDEDVLYLLAEVEIRAIDLADGSVTHLGWLPLEHDIQFGLGMTVLVPEPSSLFLMLAIVLAVGYPRRLARKCTS